MENKLELNIYMQENNRACIEFEHRGTLYRIEHLVFALQFQAEMEVAVRRMQIGGREYIYAQLANALLYKWVIEFFVMGNGLISVKLWLKDYGVNGHGTRLAGGVNYGILKLK
jgi:hypothetical protein